ncbi:MAG TPA: hypothetical protein DCL48_15645 [Alphaproteobacteria bacterium]|nr:hypothetical protein [Alphaproteobacteria bacterium]
MADGQAKVRKKAFYGRDVAQKKRFLSAALGVQHQDCLIWPYTVLDTGYGFFHENRRRVTAHRYVCEAAHGPSNGLYATHKCGVKRCVNPAHLEWGTPKKNALDKAAHGTQPHGEQHCCAVLTESEVLEACRRFKRGERAPQIAKALGHKRQTISAIVHGRNWKRLTSEVLNG